jgi:hypothetical protein
VIDELNVQVSFPDGHKASEILDLLSSMTDGPDDLWFVIQPEGKLGIKVLPGEGLFRLRDLLNEFCVDDS